MSDNIDLSKCLVYLFPSAEWAMDDNNFETLQWFSQSKKPTLAELEAAWPNVVANEEAKEQAKKDAKAAAEAKLAALGLTTDDLKALGLG
jgi:hypothetical protein